MNLSPQECERFYRIWWPFLSYVNSQEKLVENFPENPQTGSVNPQDAFKIRDALWASPTLLQGFIETNPAGLPEEDLKLAASWSNRVAGSFIIMRHLKKYSIFLLDEKIPAAFGVLGIVSSLDEVLPLSPPIMVKAVLLPFEDKIIYDSLIIPYNVSFGSGIRSGFNERLRTAQEIGGVITSLDPKDQAQTQADAILDGNKKIMAAFRKELATANMGEKTLEEHYANVDKFVKTRLHKSKPPRSLRQINAEDLEKHFRKQGVKINRVSFKRLVKFLLNSDRIDWDTAQEMERFLKTG